MSGQQNCARCGRKQCFHGEQISPWTCQEYAPEWTPEMYDREREALLGASQLTREKRRAELGRVARKAGLKTVYLVEALGVGDVPLKDHEVFWRLSDAERHLEVLKQRWHDVDCSVSLHALPLFGAP